MGFTSTRDYVDSIDAGQVTFSSWQKIPSQATVASTWFDLSMSPGDPSPQYYAAPPATSSILTARGINAGRPVSPQVKHLKTAMVMAPTAGASLPLNFILCDYLMFYPFMDMGTTDEQLMDNAATLPRYADGDSLEVMAVMVGAQGAGGQSFRISYTNEKGESGRISQDVRCNSATGVGTIITSEANGLNRQGPFIPLQGEDKGIRSIESFTMITGTDVGLIALVIVKPLASFPLFEATACTERDFMLDSPSMPVIQDGAYLNFLVNPRGTLASQRIHGFIETVWS